MHRSDLSAAIELLEAWNMTPRSPSKSEPDPERSSLILENSFVAVRAGEIVGVCSYILGKPGEGETASLAVDPSCLGQGVGFGYRIVGTNPKKHAFSLPNVDVWTVLELDLEQ
jgi:N-acetylglutamate synthase-like GNAT family acetyltransferase